MTKRFASAALDHTLASIDELLSHLAAATDQHAADIAAVPPTATASARNLAHYLAARQHDLRPLQHQLRQLALSSLGRMEADVHATVLGVRMALLGLLGALPSTAGLDADLPSLAGDQRLAANADALLGPRPPERATRVMVTLPSEAAENSGVVHELLKAGMNIARINLAHDEPDAWTRMIHFLRTASTALSSPCRVLVDLPGPKLRTGELEPGPRVLRVRPTRDAFGVCTKPATVVFLDAATDAGNDPRGVTVPLGTSVAAFAIPGDELVLVDARGRRRHFRVVAAETDRCVTTIARTAYLLAGAALSLRRGDATLATTAIGELPAIESFLTLRVDDVLVLTRDLVQGRAAHTGDDGRAVPAHIPCTLPRVFDDVRSDQRILFDDGKIAGLIVANDGDRLRVRITATPPNGGKLRAGKGINLPETELQMPAIRTDDRERLDWIAAHADMVGLSFAQRAEDVEQLHHELERRGRTDIGIVLKIETAVGFSRLPELLFAGLRRQPLGVMVARGDLAVELGYARLAEVQEEILWLCEAAHVPVIWATQVLDEMARTGMPSRAEVTDAAMSVRAECVMLNKGPHIAATVRFLGGVLERMQEHTTKKRALLRRLRVAGEPSGLPSAH